jgi:tRNA G18 (ribose-2'-O)-methylase SpoU
LPRRRLSGAKTIADALDAGTALSLLLILEEGSSDESRAVAERAKQSGIVVCAESARELRRMSEGEERAELLALVGPPPSSSLPSLMAAEGIVFALAGLRYPGNVGFILRSLEVAGAAGVVLDSDWAASQREEASRIGMRADRYLPVLDASASEAIAAARDAGRRIVALETSGRTTPWEIDWTRPMLVLIGSETTGIDPIQLAQADAVVAIPTHGFIPSYNVQAAAGIVLGEWMRQNA